LSIKSIFFDIDDTILQNNDNNTIDKELITRIKELQDMGIKVHIATGRGYVSTIPVAKKLGLKDELVIYNGAMVTDLEGNILHSELVDKNIFNELIKISREQNIHLNLYYNDTIYVENYNEYIKDYMTKTLQKLVVNSFDEYNFEHSIKCLFISESEILDKLKIYIENKIKDIYIVKSTPKYLEILNKNSNKASGVKYLLNKYGIDKENAMAFGDQNNDYDMLKYVKYGYIMGNAKDELKDKFSDDRVALHTKDSGVLKKIDEIIFNK